jgi:hypothetical protein
VAALLVMAGWLITAAVFNVRAAWALVMASALLAAVVVSSTPARAEPATGPDPSMICQQLVLGNTPDQIVAQLHSGDPRFNTLTAPRTVWDAIIEQCS